MNGIGNKTGLQRKYSLGGSKMEEIIGTLTNPNLALLLSLVFMIGELISSVLREWKNNQLNKTTTKTEMIGKLGWIVGLVLGYVVALLTGINVMLMITAVACIGTELISILDNLAELGVKIPLRKYIENEEDRE